MNTVEEHYAKHLAPIYLWMVGGHEKAFEAAAAELEVLQLPRGGEHCVLDLGAGFGAHAIPLARKGARVTAVDSSSELLETLRTLGDGLEIEIVCADLLDFLTNNRKKFDAIVCMGDTLPHMRSADEVDDLFRLCATALRPGGRLVTTFRDYTHRLESEDRFIAVRSDDQRILTCFLEFGEEDVAVHDLVHQREETGWTMRTSSYRKLRLDGDRLVARLQSMGFSARREAGTRGMVRLIADNLVAEKAGELARSELQ